MKCKAVTGNLEGELDAFNVGQELLAKAATIQQSGSFRSCSISGPS